jgi:hypothetical protein
MASLRKEDVSLTPSIICGPVPCELEPSRQRKGVSCHSIAFSVLNPSGYSLNWQEESLASGI